MGKRFGERYYERGRIDVVGQPSNKLQEKALECLELACYPYFSPIAAAIRQRLYTTYTKKSVEHKIGELTRRQYLHSTITPVMSSWITDKGRKALNASPPLP